MTKKIDLTPYHDEIVQLWQYENKTDVEISQILGICSDSVVRRYRHKHNIIRLYKDEIWLKEQFATGESAVVISRKIKCNPSVIQKAFRQLGLTNNGKKKVVNVNNIFETYTAESCYWAGFINADGHIDLYKPDHRKSINYKLGFTISKKDEDHLKKLITTLGYSSYRYGVSEIRGKSNENIQFATNKKAISLDLINNYNIVPGKKSCNEMFPQYIPQEYMKDYIRGYFDGDGCVCNSQGRLKITIVSGIQFCNDLKNFLSEEFGESIGHIYKDSKSDIGEKDTLFRYCISKKAHVEWFYNYLYQDKNCVKLERKYDIFDNYYNKI